MAEPMRRRGPMSLWKKRDEEKPQRALVKEIAFAVHGGFDSHEYCSLQRWLRGTGRSRFNLVAYESPSFRSSACCHRPRRSYRPQGNLLTCFLNPSRLLSFAADLPQ